MRSKGSRLVVVVLVLFATCAAAAHARGLAERSQRDNMARPENANLSIRKLFRSPAVNTSSASGIAQAINGQTGLVTSAEWPNTGAANPSAPSAVGVGQGALGRYMPTSGADFGIITTGSIDVIDTTNDSSSAGANNDVNINGVHDLTTLRIGINVPTGAKCLRFDSVFYSEEFPEYVGSSFNDAFFATVDSNTWSYDAYANELNAPANFAFDNHGSPLTVNSAAFVDDTDTGLEYDGSTQLLSSATPITPGDHAIYLSIFDAGDGVWDSAAFIDNLRTTTETGSKCASGTTLTDSDGDGLPNDWEIHGLDANQDGSIELDLPAMGSDPDHKDLFVELDSMSGLALSNAALKLVARAFDRAPVRNPDGIDGINLHIDAGPDSIMDIEDVTKWGALSRGGESLPVQNVLGSFSGDNYRWNAFDSIKQAHFGSQRQPVFRYALSVNQYGSGKNTSSGIARGLPGSDFLVSLGPLCPKIAMCGPGGPGGVLSQGGTFMHELGHTLGLHHGGDDDRRFEPNYLSVMNYMFQGVGMLPGGKLNSIGGFAEAPAVLDFSRFGQDVLPAVDENDLDEGAGYSDEGSEADGYETFNYCSEFVGLVKYWSIVPASGPVDFNCDNDGSDWSVSKDVNNTDGKTQLDGTNDWARIAYRGGAVGGLGLEVLLEEETADDEAPVEDIMEFAEAVYAPPDVSTGEASNVSATTADVSGVVIPDGPTSAMVEFGSDGKLDNRTELASVDTAGDLSFGLEGLEPTSSYIYRVAARGPVSDWEYGETRSFVTGTSEEDSLSVGCRNAKRLLLAAKNGRWRAIAQLGRVKKRLRSKARRSTGKFSARRALKKAKTRVRAAGKRVDRQRRRVAVACG